MASQYKLDCAYGRNTEINVVPYVQSYLRRLYDDDTLIITKYRNRKSVFDYYVDKYKLLIEIKSRRNTVEDYPTQLVGKNKISWGRTRMKNEDYKCFYFWVLNDKNDPTTKHIYNLEDKEDNEYNYRPIYDLRFKKYSMCAVIPNTELKYLTSFEV